MESERGENERECVCRCVCVGRSGWERNEGEERMEGWREDVKEKRGKE